MTSTDVATRTGEGVEKKTAHERRMTALYRDCIQLAKSELVPKALRDKPDNVFALALYGERFGLSPIHAVQRIYLIEGTFQEKAEVLGGVVIRAGHELRWDEVSAERCTVSIRRRDSNDWQTTTWTLEDARRAGLLDVWVEQRVEDGKWPNGDKKYRVEKFVVGDDTGVFTAEERARRALGPVPEWAQQKLDAGDVRRRDTWAQFPGDMLAAKALRRAAKRIVGDALLGLDVDDDAFEPLTPEKVLATRDDPDGDPEDPDDDEPSDVLPPDPAPAADDEDPIEDAELVDTPTPPDESFPESDDIDAAQHRSALLRLMRTCNEAFPETNAPKGKKSKRQRLLRRAAQWAVLGVHRPADELTTDELQKVEAWIYRFLLDDATVTKMTYEIGDDDRVTFTFNDKSVTIDPEPESSSEAA